ncbi:MAG: hypothetical protein Q7W13_12180 [Bacteroidia bacterium]|nr:hypothetical protein [Bacteroidia bacterium]
MKNTPKLILHEKSRLIAIEKLLSIDDPKTIINNLETMYLGYVGSQLSEDMSCRHNETIALLYLNMNRFFQSISQDNFKDQEFIKEYQRMYYFIVLSGMADKYKLFETQYNSIDIEDYEDKLKSIHLQAKHFIIHIN